MNLFMPFPDIKRSVESLDDKRLIKQILECYQIHRVAMGASTGYKNHPIVAFYTNHHKFVADYGHYCCLEYTHRTGKQHRYSDYFEAYYNIPHSELRSLIFTKCDNDIFYAEYSKNDPRCIRTNENKEVCRLYQKKLCNKWDRDSRKQRNAYWTHREVPDFYLQHRNVIEQMKLMNY